MKENKIANAVGVAGLILCAVLAIGVKTFFGACDPKDDGSWMSCHWAEQAVFGLAVTIAVMFGMMILFRRFDTKKGVACAVIQVALLTMIIPNTLVRLCLKQEMVCHSTMAPAVRVLAAAIAAVALIEVVILAIQGRMERKKQPAVQVSETVQQMEEAAQQMSPAGQIAEEEIPAENTGGEWLPGGEGQTDPSNTEAETEDPQ